MEIIEGYIRSWFEERKFGYLRNKITKADSFFHLSDCNVPTDKIIVGAPVRYSLTEYEQKGQRRVKAINIERIVPIPERAFEPVVPAAPVPTPEPVKPVGAIGGQGIPTPTAARSLAIDSAKAKKPASTSLRAMQLLSEAKPTEQNIRPRGMPKPAPTDGSGEVQ